MAASDEAILSEYTLFSTLIENTSIYKWNAVG